MEHGGGAGAVLTRIVTISETGSTNADLLVLARGAAEDGLWLSAGRQTAGRGRQGRLWSSPEGNVSASTLVRLRPIDPPAATLALVAAVALADTVLTFHPRERRDELRLKWPNDLLLAGAKLSGILLERAENAVVIGFGVNLAHHPALPDRPTTSLAAHGTTVSPAIFVETLAEGFRDWRACWQRDGLAPIRTRWLAMAHARGAALTVRLPDGTSIDGLFDGLDEGGALLLRLAGGERRVIHAADVFLL